MEDPAEVVTPPGAEVSVDGVPPPIVADRAVLANGVTTAASGGAGRHSDAAAVNAGRADAGPTRGGSDRGGSTDVVSGSGATGGPARKLSGARVAQRSE